MSNYAILTHSEHPLNNSLKGENIIHYYHDHGKFVEQINASKEVDVLIDLTLLKSEEKNALYLKLKHNAPFDLKIIADLSCAWGDLLMKKYPFVYAAAPLAFYSPKQTYEVCINNEKVRDVLEAFFSAHEFKIHEVSQAGVGFTYPRTLCQVINEAYFALEEGLCTEEDLDQAMQKGVNYPLGPLDWAKQIGHGPICYLLDELFNVTRDPRYRASTRLRMQAELEMAKN